MVNTLQFIVTVMTLLAYPASALAVEWCDSRDRIITILTQAGENPHMLLLSDSGSVIEVHVNEADQSFTVLRTEPGGESCVLATGQGIEHIPIPCDPRKGCKES